MWEGPEIDEADREKWAWERLLQVHVIEMRDEKIVLQQTLPG